MSGLFRSKSKRRSNNQRRIDVSQRSASSSRTRDESSSNRASQRSKVTHRRFTNKPKPTSISALQPEQANPIPSKVRSNVQTPVRGCVNGRNGINVATISTPDTVAEETYGSLWHEWVSRQKWDRIREKLRECIESEKWNKKKKYVRRGKKISLVTDDIALQDANGETAIHVGLHEVDMPFDVLLSMIQASAKASRVADQNGYLPLHVAAKEGHRMKIIAEICLVNPEGLSTQDNFGLTALDHAVEVAKHLQKKSTILQKHRAWEYIGDDETEQKADMLMWQEQQTKRWAVVKWLLLSSSVNPISSLQVGEKQPLLLDALIHSAPPSVVSLLTAASASCFKDPIQGISFACSAMYLCISRRYPPLVLKNIAEQSPEDTKNVKDETGMGLLAAQHIVGTMEQDARNKWILRPSYLSILKKCTKDKSLTRATNSFLDWWIKTKFLIGFCHQTSSSENCTDDYLLHKALSNDDTPPTVIKLLLALYPESASMPDPSCNALPLHLHCMAGAYIKRYYEPSEDGMRTKMEMLVKANPNAVSCRFLGRTPLHLALDAGKTWYEVKGLTSANRRLLRKRDPTTKLYPFQMAAMKRDLTIDDKARLAFKARNEYPDDKWQSLKSKSKLNALKKVQREEDIEQLQTIFEFLRRFPNAVRGGIEKPKPPKLDEARDEHGKGMVATHYLSWVYAGEQENYRPLVDRMRTIATAIKLGKEEKISKEFDVWWNKMKFWIWYCYQGEEGNSPKEGTLVMPKIYDFMVHAAISNSDTPPQIVHLLLELYTGSIKMPLPETNMYPLHIMASTTSYTPREFELPYINTMDLLVRAFPDAAQIWCNGKLPLHMAIEAGKTWKELKRLVEVGTETLLSRDPESGLYPFQMMALHRSYNSELRVRFQHVTRNRVGTKKWKKMKRKEKSKEMRETQKRYDRSITSTIYELLRLCPAALECPKLMQEEEQSATLSDTVMLEHMKEEEVKLSDTVMFEHKKEEEAVKQSDKVMLEHKKEEKAMKLPDTAILERRKETEESALKQTTLAGSGSFDAEESEYPEDEHRQDKASAFASFHAMSMISESDGYLHNKSEVMVEDESRDSAVDDSVLRGELLVDDDDDDDESDMWTYVSKIQQNTSHTIDPEDATAISDGSEKKEEEAVENETKKVVLGDALVEVKETRMENDGGFAVITSKIAKETLLSDEHDMDEPESEEQGAVIEDFLSDVKEIKSEDSTQTTDEDTSSEVRVEPEPCKEIAEAFEKLHHVETPSKLARSSELISEQFAKSSPKLVHVASSPSRKLVKPDPVAVCIAEAPSHLKHVEKPPEDQSAKPPTPDRGTLKIREASTRLKHTMDTKESHASSIRVATKSQDEILTQEERLGTYRSGWSNTPAMQRRRQNRFGVINENKEKFLPCMLCSNGKREVLMLPCRHLCLCPRCSVTQKVGKCPTCSKDVESTMVVYL